MHHEQSDGKVPFLLLVLLLLWEQLVAQLQWGHAQKCTCFPECRRREQSDGKAPF